jgi:hypothetical protein
MMPLTLPALAALATLEFTWIFNDFLWALILIQDDKLKPVTTGLAALQGQYVMDWTVIVAGWIATCRTALSSRCHRSCSHCAYHRSARMRSLASGFASTELSCSSSSRA